MSELVDQTPAEDNNGSIMAELVDQTPAEDNNESIMAELVDQTPAEAMDIDMPTTTDGNPAEEITADAVIVSDTKQPRKAAKGKRQSKGSENASQASRKPANGKETKTPKQTPAQSRAQRAQKLTSRRAKKSSLTAGNEGPQAHLPSPPGSPKKSEELSSTLTKPPATSRSGRQNAGAYSREEVHALQTWINVKITDDWDAIAQEVGKVTGVYRHKDNLRSLYGTVIMRQIYSCFPPRNGVESGVLVSDIIHRVDEVEGGKEAVCGSCGARLIGEMIEAEEPAAKEGQDETHKPLL